MRRVSVSVGVAFALGMVSPVMPTARAESADKGVETVKRALAAFEREDCPGAVRLLKPALKPAAAAQLPEAVAAAAYYLAATCLAGKDLAEARRMAIAGTALAEAPDGLWHLRLGIDLDSGDNAAALATLAAMTEGRGGALNTVPMRWLYQLSRKLNGAGSEGLRLQFLRIMTADAYDPDEAGASKNGFRYDLAKILAGNGDTAAAAAQIALIDSASILLTMSYDARTGPLMPAGFDPRAAMERELANARANMLRHPDALSPLLGAVGNLRALGRPKEALELLEAARAGGKKIEDYADADEFRNWWWDAMARTQEMMGNADATFVAFTQGAGEKENGGDNVSQTINLAHAQNRFGRHADALKTLPSTDKGFSASPYGAMEMRLARGCANAALGNMPAYATDLSYAREHAKDNWQVLVDLYLCGGDLDGAAVALIGNLTDADNRAEALVWLSDYDAALPGRPLYSFEKRLNELKARADVKAAIDKAGGIRRVRLQRGEL
ncbi:hypothetical protein [Sphingomonas sp. LT1P40]|uniref:hypothetical protein n=1 Tax=Alteristakelama amylovorans TaxID=3096166 RepID=UPI002FCC0D75